MTGGRGAQITLRLAVAAGLATDAVVHAALAPNRPPNGVLNQIALFRAEAAAAGVLAVLVLAHGRRWVYALAALVAGSAFAAVVLYRYLDLGPLGPLPDMYEPFWTTSKVVVTVAEGLTVILAALGYRSSGAEPLARSTRTR